MNLEEYLNKDPKARATAMLLANGIDKTAGWDDILKSLVSKFKRAGGRITKAGQKAVAADLFKTPIRSQLSGMAGQLKNELASGGKQLWSGVKKYPYETAIGGVTLGSAGLAALPEKKQRDINKAASAEPQPVSLHKYAAELGCPTSMRLIAHIMEGHGDWLTKVAACAKKNAKCSKVEHKTMPCGK